MRAKEAEPRLDQSPSHAERVRVLAECELNKDFSLLNEPAGRVGARGKLLKTPVVNVGGRVAFRRKKTWT